MYVCIGVKSAWRLRTVTSSTRKTRFVYAYIHTYIHINLRFFNFYVASWLPLYTYIQDGQKVREEMAMAVQEVMYKWLHETDEMKRRVAIFDGKAYIHTQPSWWRRTMLFKCDAIHTYIQKRIIFCRIWCDVSMYVCMYVCSDQHHCEPSIGADAPRAERRRLPTLCGVHLRRPRGFTYFSYIHTYIHTHIHTYIHTHKISILVLTYIIYT